VQRCSKRHYGEKNQVSQTLQEIEQNLKSRKQTDKIMWFSMWATLSVASFGIAWFPMVYNLIKRRNEHFARRANLEKLIVTKLETKNEEKVSTSTMDAPINALAWTVASVLIVPAFYIFYKIKKDLESHEMHEHDFLAEVIELAKECDQPLKIEGFMTTPSFSAGKYIGLSVVSCGLAVAYWLYRIFNDYNSHFKMQWKNEDKLLNFLKAIDKKTC
jgi:hypothetical protein